MSGHPEGVSVVRLESANRDLLRKVAPGVFDREVPDATLDDFLAGDRQVAFLAVHAGTVVGMATGVVYSNPDKPRELWINEVGVADAFLRRGIAGALLEEAEGHARASGCADVWVLTERDNAPARGLYRSRPGWEGPEDALLYSVKLEPAEARAPEPRSPRAEVEVSAAGPPDADDWLRMRRALWPDGSEEEHHGEIEAFVAGRFPRSPWEVLVARTPDGRAAGFAELSVRPWAEGCEGTEVAYLEGWYVEPHVRRSGVGLALVAAAEDWARARDLGEIASDADPANAASHAAHRAAGFRDAGLVRCFAKRL